MKKALTTTAPTALPGAGTGAVSPRGHRAASLRSAVGVRGRIASGTSESGMNPLTTTTASVPPVDADIELVAARGRRVAALRSLVGASGRTSREARSVA
ncbi:hypothetical protein RB628_32560 [Streptomyces sp. ADMS]|uniref:hypothetical protein n=1 Tax=Streptomyces sp. ADMS TaxID=3071415 RepID=UPI00296EE84A|nr:hypothetical protein [Streptomyces sp. ADMS]MDW4909938.1 hypothetical protein [Streptomyces sp. ADMS]